MLRCWPLSRFSSSCWNLFDFPAPQSSGSELAPAHFFVASFAYLGTEAMPGSFLFPVNLPFNFIRVPRPVILSWCVLFLVGKVFLLPVPAVTLHCVLGWCVLELSLWQGLGWSLAALPPTWCAWGYHCWGTRGVPSSTGQAQELSLNPSAYRGESEGSKEQNLFGVVLKPSRSSRASFPFVSH